MKGKIGIILRGKKRKEKLAICFGEARGERVRHMGRAAGDF